MANPIGNEMELYESFKKEKVRVDPRVWELINHHVRNDLNHISVAVGLFAFLPEDILTEVDEYVKKLCKEKGLPGDPPPELKRCLDSSLEHIKSTDKFLRALYELTTEE